MRPIFTIVLFMLCSFLVLGQDTSKAEIFAGYSYGNYELFSAPPSILTSNTTTTVSSTSRARLSMSGWNSSAAVKMNRWFGFATDFSGYYSSSSAAATTTETGFRCTRRQLPCGLFRRSQQTSQSPIRRPSQLGRNGCSNGPHNTS